MRIKVLGNKISPKGLHLLKIMLFKKAILIFVLNQDLTNRKTDLVLALE